MFRSSATIRISFTLASITACTCLVALTIGIFPDRIGAVADGRKTLCESVTVSCSLAARRGDRESIKANLQAVAARNPDVISAALRRSDGTLHMVVGEHESHWPKELKRSTLTHMHVPIHVNEDLWGRLELCFAPPGEQNWSILPTSALRLMLFLVSASLLGHFIYLRRVLRQLDPSKVIPERVRQTLDSLAEGLLVLDRDQRIVLANEAFAQTIDRRADELQGHKASELPWSERRDGDSVPPYPWETSIRDGVVETGQLVKLGDDESARRIFQVNAAPIIGEGGESRGALASFSDITALEVRNSQLGETLIRLQQTRDQICEQNERLRTLAMVDPLTQCLNRRAFFEELETRISAADRTGRPLGYVIMDIDRFKLVNDNHGHKVGDDVLKEVSQLLKTHIDDRGFVCRYGGEEFSVLLPEFNIVQAAELADNLRKQLETTPIAHLKVTASFGVVQFDPDAAEPLEALDRADKALYFAKRSGRNRIVRWDQIPRGVEFSRTIGESGTRDATEAKTHIPFTAVSVLLSALDCRDAATAEHSRRVANLCVAIAAGIMSEEQRYVLEVAALLHDIGKLSVPDTILLKSGPLSLEEWKVMDTHLRFGEKTVKNAFASPELVSVLRTYRAPFCGNPHDPSLPSGDGIPVSARILHIADAYDAMVSPRVYRKQMCEEEAFAELQCCAGTQFDPELVERCIRVVLSRSERRMPTIAGVSADVALRIGSELERLVLAIDGQDAVSLEEMAERLRAIAEESGIHPIVELTNNLRQEIDNDATWTDTLRICSELLELCRQTQHAYTSSRELAVGGN